MSKNPISPAIFKTYDVRGIYPEEVNEKVAYLIGRSFVVFLGKKSPRIVVARDNRLSSPALFKSVVKGIIDQGGIAVDTGLATTPLFYWTVAKYKYDGGIGITASHNPPVFNGFKIVREGADPVSGESGLKQIRDLAIEGKFEVRPKGKVIKKSSMDSYIREAVKNSSFKASRRLRIVIDTANAVSGMMIPMVFKKPAWKIFHLLKKLDGHFPGHLPDPLLKENIKFLQDKVIENKADIGIAFDGDGDRIFFVDEKGEIIPADILAAFIDSIILRGKPGEKILYDLRSSNIIRDTVKQLHGKPVMWKCGHALIKIKMKEDDILFGSEVSGHYFFKDSYYFEAPFSVAFTVLEEMTETGKNLSELIKPFKKYFHSGEINFKVQDKDKIMNQLVNEYQGGRLSRLDGVKIDFPDWWFNVRSSNTEPVLRLVVEAKTKAVMEEMVKEITEIINQTI